MALVVRVDVAVLVMDKVGVVDVVAVVVPVVDDVAVVVAVEVCVNVGVDVADSVLVLVRVVVCVEVCVVLVVGVVVSVLVGVVVGVVSLQFLNEPSASDARAALTVAATAAHVLSSIRYPCAVHVSLGFRSGL